MSFLETCHFIKAENELLVFELYKAYRELNSKAEPFDSFITGANDPE
jgi:hypothetical protein